MYAVVRGHHGAGSSARGWAQGRGFRGMDGGGGFRCPVGKCQVNDHLWKEFEAIPRLSRGWKWCEEVRRCGTGPGAMAVNVNARIGYNSAGHSVCGCGISIGSQRMPWRGCRATQRVRGEASVSALPPPLEGSRVGH